jgi:hypothetical protein
MQNVKDRVDELITLYTGPEFKGCTAAARGYHLVRALDYEVYCQLFSPWKPTIDYKQAGPHEITVTITGYSPQAWSINIKDSDNEKT